MSNTVKVKLVGASRYISPMTGDAVVEAGQVVDVDEKYLDTLLAEVKVDALDNEHPVWEQVAEDASDAKPKGVRVARAAKAKKAEGDTAAGDDAAGEDE
jgi:hypothetical protein